MRSMTAALQTVLKLLLMLYGVILFLPIVIIMRKYLVCMMMI